MAGFTTQIEERFKAKFANVNLTKTRLKSITDKLDLKIESEDEIDAKLDELNEIIPFAELAKQDDRLRDLEAKSRGGKTPEQIAAEKKAAEEAAGGGAPEGETATEKLLREILEGQKAMAERVNAIEGEKTIASRRSQLETKLKDAPESYKKTVLKNFDRMKFDTDEDFNSFVEETEADVTEVIQEQSNAGLGKDKPARSGGGLDKKLATDKELDAVIGNLKI